MGIEVIRVERKAVVLGPSSLPCLAKASTVNISAGCSHGCVYCYSKCYSNYPGDGRVAVFGNLAQKIADELGRKRRPPVSVYFCPSCDPFQNVSEVLESSFEIMSMLLERGIAVEFLTKGVLPERFFKLFATRPELVSGQIGIACADESLRKILEPGAASVDERFSNLRRLSELCIDACVRADPLIYGVTDSDEMIEGLCRRACSFTSRMAVSYLFLRPGIKKRIEAIGDHGLGAKIIEAFGTGCKIQIGTGQSAGMAIDAEKRAQSYERIRMIAGRFGMSVHVCGCKNNDVADERCGIVRKREREASLF